MSSESISTSRISWRVTCLESSEHLLIKILTPKQITTLTILLALLTVWWFFFFGQGEFGFSLNLLCAAIVTVLFPLYTFLWNLVGKEIIEINKDKLVVRQSIFGVGFRQTYQLSLISNLRASLANPAMFTLENNLQEWGFAGGSVAFDYKGSICRFGLLLWKQEAELLVTKINQYLARPTQNPSTLAVKA